MAARSNIGYTDLWVREYCRRDPRPRIGWRILGNFPYFLVKDIVADVPGIMMGFKKG
jgi:hypothetical protein